MTSVELFRLLFFLKNLHYTYIFILFSPEIYYGSRVTSFHEENSNILHQIMV